MSPDPVLLRRVVVLVVVASLLPVAGPASADEPASFTYDGRVRVGNPGTEATVGFSEGSWVLTGERTFVGLDGDLVALPAWTVGRQIWVNGTAPTAYDLDVYFYNADRLWIGEGDPFDASGRTCRSSRVDETCVVPVGTSYVFVNLFVGAAASYRIQVRDVAGPEPVFTAPTYYSWGPEDVHDIQVVVMPALEPPIYHSDLATFPEGDGVLYDSPYLRTTFEMLQSWREALDAYADAHPEASELRDVRWTTRVVGIDATMEDWVLADVAISFVPTTVALTAGGHYTIIAPEGRYERCEVIPHTWLGFSYTLNDFYTTSSIEFGHCLGVYHVETPATDIQNPFYDYVIGNPATPRVCISSLDVAAIASVYTWMDDGETWRPGPGRVAEPRSQYTLYPAVGGAQSSCPNEV